MERGAWRAPVHGVTKSLTQRGGCTTATNVTEEADLLCLACSWTSVCGTMTAPPARGEGASVTACVLGGVLQNSFPAPHASDM